MTSTGSAGRRGANKEGGIWRALGLVALLAAAAWQIQGPWGALCLLVPLVTTLSLLLAWRYGGWATLVPVVVFAVSVATFPLDPLWAGWLPAAALSAVWMGLREEAGALAGERAWMLSPLLVVAALLPWTPGYVRAVEAVGLTLRGMEAQALGFYRELGMSPDRLQNLEKMFAESARLRDLVLPHALPGALFVWVAVLVHAGRALASRAARLLRWPRLAAAPFGQWRLPDAVLWVMLLGLALLVLRVRVWTPTAWTLTAVAALGYCLQGVAVVQSLLLARGFPPYMVAILIVFVLAMGGPAFPFLAACIGVSDVWLDYRKLERVGTNGDS